MAATRMIASDSEDRLSAERLSGSNTDEFATE
jgi:hypothetical protein